MRQAKREIKDPADVLQVLDCCDTIRIGFHGQDFPYVVPVSFGWEQTPRGVVIYFHGAKEGYKQDLMARDNRVCVEADRLLGYTDTGHSATAEYESVIGFGTVEHCDYEASVHGLALLMQHCKLPGYSAKACADLGITDVYAIYLHTLTGKRHIV